MVDRFYEKKGLIYINITNKNQSLAATKSLSYYLLLFIALVFIILSSLERYSTNRGPYNVVLLAERINH